MKNKKPAINRLQAREMERKFNPAIKVLSSYMHNTGKVTNDLIGYKIPAGSFTDAAGRTWQVQAHAIVSKKHQIKKDEVKPIVRKGAIGLRVRVFFKYLIDSLFKE